LHLVLTFGTNEWRQAYTVIRALAFGAALQRCLPGIGLEAVLALFHLTRCPSERRHLDTSCEIASEVERRLIFSGSSLWLILIGEIRCPPV